MEDFFIELFMKLGLIVLSAGICAAFAGIAYWLKDLDSEVGPILMTIWVLLGGGIALFCAWSLILK